MKHWFKADICGEIASAVVPKSYVNGAVNQVQFTVRRTRGACFDYARVTAWRQLAKDCLDFLKEGDTVRIRGDCRSSTYTKNGIKTHAYEIVVTDYTKGDDIEICDTEEENEQTK
jgi:single-stranded DNA-binding protein